MTEAEIENELRLQFAAQPSLEMIASYRLAWRARKELDARICRGVWKPGDWSDGVLYVPRREVERFDALIEEMRNDGQES